jgi:ABC-type anion transport system duplicated permease subunit
MQPLQFLVPLDPLVAAESVIPFVVLALVLANMVTRLLAHRTHVEQAKDAEDDSEISRYLPHSVTTVLLVLASFAFLVVAPHGGMVMSVLVLGVFLADFFEFESRKVEARNEMEMERPKAAVTASLVALLYAAFQSLFFIVEPVWTAIV